MGYNANGGIYDQAINQETGNGVYTPNEQGAFANQSNNAVFDKQSPGGEFEDPNTAQMSVQASRAEIAARAAIDAKDAALIAEANAELAEVNAETAQAAAEAALAGIGTSVSTAAASATAAANSATNAATSATSASTSASSASTSASTATTQANNASSSATSASTSATNASSSASAAATSATNAASSATSASGSASTATTQATSASTSATNAASSATNASTSATTATTQAGIATTQATNASNSATSANSSATNASTSATTATTQAGIATTQATNASTSATNASNSATSSASSATASSNSASSASTSATTATNKASEAGVSASNASASATSAGSSATAAAGSVTSANTFANNAATSATNASNSATSANTSASNASTSATSASGSATTATTQAGIATTKAGEASSSAASASSSAISAALSYDSFDDRYLGAKSVEPTLDNDGNALLTGALYFSTVTNELKVWTGSFWTNAGGSREFTPVYVKTSFVATSGQTVFTVGYIIGNIEPFVNGILLDPSEFTATNGTSVTLSSPCVVGDNVSFLGYNLVNTAGLSAYEVAVANGYTGTESAWLTSLIGATGAAGATGATGATGTAGTNGTNGIGVPTGGTTGQVLAKTSSTDYATGWASLSTVATTGAYNDLSGRPTLGTAASASTTDFATATQGTNANTAYGWGNHASAGYLTTSVATSTYQPIGTYLTSSSIGSSVQAYNANLTSWTAITPSTKQDTLVSGTNIKTINSASLLGAGNIALATSGANTDITSVTLTSGTISASPSSSNDIVNKSYADSIVSGVNFHAACNYATTTALPTNTYSNGTAGVGATLTAIASGALSVDGSSPVVGNRILVKNEVIQINNGVYTVTQVGSGVLPYILTRATDYDSSGSGTNEIDQGDMMLVLSGTTNSNTSWVQQTSLPITLGTTALVFLQFAAIQTYTAGTGLNLATNQFSITNTGTAGTYGSATLIPVITTNAQGQVTGVTTAANPQGTITSVTGTAPVVSSGGTTPAISMPAATTSVNGYLTSTDWNTFNGKQPAGTYATGAGTASGTNTGDETTATIKSKLSITTLSGSNTGDETTATIKTKLGAASTTADGYLTTADWNTFNGKQPAGSYIVSGGALGTPLTGTLTNCTGLPYSGLTGTVPTWNQSTTGNAATVTNGVYTTGSYANPTWITGLDYSKLSGTVPTWNQNTTGTASNITGNLAIANLNSGTGASSTTFWRGDGTWATPASSGGGSGTVTSVSGTGTVSGLSLSGTVTNSGSLTLGGTLSLTSGNVTTALGYTPYSNTNPSGYISSYTETDPVFIASPAYGITGTNITNWSTAYGWGNHASAGYLTSAAIGSTVQAYGINLTSWAAIAPSTKQDTLVSATNIKTINGASVLGSGDLTVSGSFAGGTLTSPLVLAAGTATAGTAPLKFQTGTLLTTAEAGAVEYVSNTFYASPAASTRAVLPTEQWVVLTGTNTLTSQTTVQPIFDGGGGPTNGSVTLPIGTYQFECVYALTAMSATSGSFGFALGGAATFTYSYDATASKAGTAAATSQAGFKLFSSAAATALVTNSTGTVGSALIKGIIRVTVAGTIVPQVSLTVAAAAIISANSYFKVSPLGNVSTVATVGNWA